jgi:hypothetical protein
VEVEINWYSVAGLLYFKLKKCVAYLHPSSKRLFLIFSSTLNTGFHTGAGAVNATFDSVTSKAHKSPIQSWIPKEQSTGETEPQCNQNTMQEPPYKIKCNPSLSWWLRKKKIRKDITLFTLILQYCRIEYHMRVQDGTSTHIADTILPRHIMFSPHI